MSIWSSFFTLHESEPLGAPWVPDWQPEERAAFFDVASCAGDVLRFTVGDESVMLDRAQVAALIEALLRWRPLGVTE